MELAALEAGVAPLRYLRNIGTIGLAGQAAYCGPGGVVGLGAWRYNLEDWPGRGGAHHRRGQRPVREHNLNRQASAASTTWSAQSQAAQARGGHQRRRGGDRSPGRLTAECRRPPGGADHRDALDN